MMKKILKRIRNRAGETLVETLAAILVAALSAAALSMGIMTNTKSETKITDFQREIEAQVKEAEICACEGTDPKEFTLFLTERDGTKISRPTEELEEEPRYYEQRFTVFITGGNDKITSFKINNPEEAGE